MEISSERSLLCIVIVLLIIAFGIKTSIFDTILIPKICEFFVFA